MNKSFIITNIGWYKMPPAVDALGKNANRYTWPTIRRMLAENLNPLDYVFRAVYLGQNRCMIFVDVDEDAITGKTKWMSDYNVNEVATFLLDLARRYPNKPIRGCVLLCDIDAVPKGTLIEFCESEIGRDCQ